MVSKSPSSGDPPAGAPLERRIVDAAGALFLSRGFVRVTADDIATEIGVSKATLYKEFASKEDILRAVVRDLMAEIVARVDAIINNEEQSLVERLVALFAFVGGRLSLLGPVLTPDSIARPPADMRSATQE